MRNPTTAKPLLPDFNEAAKLVDEVSGLLAMAESSLGDLTTIFEAIAATTSAGSLARRLADLGARTAETESDCFGGYKREYNGHARRLLSTCAEVSHG